MRRFVAGAGYARLRLAAGFLFVVLGAITAVRTVAAAGPSLAALPGIVLGLALVALGVLRIRDGAVSRRPR